MASAADELVQTADSAVAAGDFVTARTAFEAMVERDPTPEALAGLGDTLWWLGRTDEAVRYQERAYAGFRRRGDVAQSAFMAVGLYLGYRVSLGNVAAARGWLGRAARLVDAGPLVPLAGWVKLLRAHDSADPAAAERWSRRPSTPPPVSMIRTWSCARSASSGRRCCNRGRPRRARRCSTRRWRPRWPVNAGGRTPWSTPAVP